MPALPVLLLASLALEVSGHGGMVWPPIWQDGHYTSLNKITGYKIYSDPKVKDPNTGLSIADARAWLTDQAYIGGHGDNFKKTGEQTNFKDCGSTCSSLKHPWAAPGRAPNLGGGCGIHGGNPYGCPAGNDTRPPGSVCPPDGDRGTWSFGSSALEIEFPEARTTKWSRGSTVPVGYLAIWHGGGYTYRLCKMPAEGKAGLTEECFTKNVLKFSS